MGKCCTMVKYEMGKRLQYLIMKSEILPTIIKMRDTGVLRMNKWKNFKAALCLGIAMSMAVVSTVSANVTGAFCGAGGGDGAKPGAGAADAAEPDRLIQPFAPSGSFRNRYNIPGERDNWYGQGHDRLPRELLQVLWRLRLWHPRGRYSTML